MQLELLVHPVEDTGDLLARLARLLRLFDYPLSLKKRVVADPSVPTPALRVEGSNYPFAASASDEELLELLDELIDPV